MTASEITSKNYTDSKDEINSTLAMLQMDLNFVKRFNGEYDAKDMDSLLFTADAIAFYAKMLKRDIERLGRNIKA